MLGLLRGSVVHLAKPDLAFFPFIPKGLDYHVAFHGSLLMLPLPGRAYKRYGQTKTRLATVMSTPVIRPDEEMDTPSGRAWAI